MKIIHVEDYFDPVAGYQINELLIAGKDNSDEIYLITSNDMSPFHKKVDKKLDLEFEKKTGVKLIRLEPILKMSTRLILRNLNETINKINPDVVFMHGIGDFKDIQLWKKKKSYKIIRDCHMSWVASKNRFRKLYYLLYRILFSKVINNTDKYSIIYALGEEEYEYLKVLGINDNKIDYLYHGYNDDVMFYDEFARKEIREKYNFEIDDIVITYIGKFNNSKQPDLIFDIVDQFEEKYILDKKLKLLFIGPKEGDYIKKFNKKMNQVKNKIDIIVDEAKPFNELRKYFSASEVCIFPKECTLSAIHAQVCRCQVIMEDHKSNIERVVNVNNLYHVGNLSMAKDIIRKIIEKKEYVKQEFVFKDFLEKREYKRQVEYFLNKL